MYSFWAFRVGRPSKWLAGRLNTSNQIESLSALLCSSELAWADLGPGLAFFLGFCLVMSLSKSFQNVLLMRSFDSGSGIKMRTSLEDLR